MPCDSGYLQPTQREKELRHAARLFGYVKEQLGKKPPKWAVALANEPYVNDDRAVIELCRLLRNLRDKKPETFDAQAGRLVGGARSGRQGAEDARRRGGGSSTTARRSGAQQAHCRRTEGARSAGHHRLSV